MKTAVKYPGLCHCRDCGIEARAINARDRAIKRVKRERRLRWCRHAAIVTVAYALFFVGAIYAMGWALSVAPTIQALQ